MGAPGSLAVLVRARNEAQHLPKLIEGLAKQTVAASEIILVDSGSTDATVEIASSAGWKIIHLDPQDFTFGKSLNTGFEHCTSEIVVIISAHVYPTRKDYLEVITRQVTPSGMTIAYGRQVGDERTKFSEKVLMSKWFPSERIPDQGHAFTNNANACVPRALWEKLRYNEALTGLEDIDFSMRVLALGGSIVYEEEAEIVHVHEEAYREVAKRYKREAIAYKVIYPGERMTWVGALRLALRNAWRDLVEAANERVLNQVWMSILRFRFSQFYGAWRGFRQAGNPDSELMRRMYYPPSRKTLEPSKNSVQKIEYLDDAH